MVAAGIAQYVYLVFVFPVVMITFAVWVVSQLGRMGKIRNRLLLALSAFWMSILMYGSFWTGEYLFLVENIYQQSGEGDDTRLDILEEINLELQEETGYPHTLGYVLWSIEGGLELVSTSPGDDSVWSLNPQQTAIYWGVEALAVVFLTTWVSYIFGSKPFSEACNQWYDKADPEFIGYVLNDEWKTFIEHLRAGDLDSAARLVNMQEGGTELYAYAFPDCNSDELLFKAIQYQGRNTVEVDGIMTQSALDRFRGLI